MKIYIQICKHDQRNQTISVVTSSRHYDTILCFRRRFRNNILLLTFSRHKEIIKKDIEANDRSTICKIIKGEVDKSKRI